MKNKALFIGALIMSFVLTLSSCKKDEDQQLTPKQVNGTFHAFEMTINGETITLPTDDEKVDILISTSGNHRAKVTLIEYYNETKSKFPFNCQLTKDDVGAIHLSGSTDNRRISVNVWDKNTIDCTIVNDDTHQEMLIGASKDGKKPSDW